MARDSVGNTMLVATILCVVCSVLVASAAVGLRSTQEANKQLDQKKNVLIAAGLFDTKENTADQIDEIFQSSIERVLIDLETGAPVDADTVDASTYDQLEAASTPELSTPIEPAAALGGIKRREKYAFVYQVKSEAGEVEDVVLPVYGKGLWSTLYGFLAVAADADTVEGITFYQHKETPGLGGEVDNPAWKEQWQGKKIFSDDGEVALQLIKGTVDADALGAEHEIDGLSGATITGNGVSQLIRYWMGPQGFGPYLNELRQPAGGETDG